MGLEGVLLVRRAKPPLVGEWSLPGGAVELGETLAEALVREIAEETGVQVRVGPLLDVLDRIHLDDGTRVEYHYVLLDYLCTPVGGELRAGSDAAAARWVAPDRLSDYQLGDAAVAIVAKALEWAGREG